MSLQVQGLQVARGHKMVLHQVDLQLEPGQSCALVGPNGAGKSTLLQALAGLVPRSAGTVLVDGVDPEKLPRRQLVQHLSLMPQSLQTPFDFSALELVRMGKSASLPLLGRSSREDDRHAQEALDQLGVGALASRPVTSLSGGERQRVHFALQLVQGARVMLLDEPTSALDFEGIRRVIQAIEERRAAGHTLLVALHDLNLAASAFDRLALLHQGKICDFGTPAQVLAGEPLREAYQGAFKRLDTHWGPIILPPGRRRNLAQGVSSIDAKDAP